MKPQVTPGTTLKRRLQEISFIAALQLLTKLRGLILVPVMLRSFGAANYGVWIQLTVASNLLCGLSQANLHSCLVRYLPAADRSGRGAIFWNGFAWVIGSSAVLGAFVSFVADDIVAHHVDVPRDTLLWLGMMVLTRSLWQYISNLFRADGKGQTFAALEAIPSLIELVAVIIGAVRGASLHVALVTLITMETISVVAMLGFAVRTVPLVRPSIARLSPLLRYALPGLPVNVSNFVLTFSDRYIISMFMGSAAVGIYSAAYALASTPSFLVRPLLVVLIPRAAKAWDMGNREGAVTTLRRHIKLFLFVGIPAVAGLAVVGPAALSLLAGHPDPNWTFALFLSIASGSFLLGLLILGLHTYLLEENVGASAWLYLGCAAINVLLNFLLLPRIGLLGAGIATAVAYGGACLLVQLHARKSMGSIIDLKAMGVAIVAAGAMGFVVAMIDGNSVARLTVSIVVGVITYFATAWLLGFFDVHERGLVLALIKRRSA